MPARKSGPSVSPRCLSGSDAIRPRCLNTASRKPVLLAEDVRVTERSVADMLGGALALP